MGYIARLGSLHEGREQGRRMQALRLSWKKYNPRTSKKIDTQQKNTHVSTLFYLYICQWDKSK